MVGGGGDGVARGEERLHSVNNNIAMIVCKRFVAKMFHKIKGEHENKNSFSFRCKTRYIHTYIENRP